ncbi:topoisomerase [Pseudonocardiaceae bacterium YIM PH 21723]|nr:topoisomerase [Pseudonocardiaceae bacterium YIM PH 21723]
MIEAAKRYHQALPGSPADDYLASRGLLGAASEGSPLLAARLGYVADPPPGFEQYAGMLAIPYLRRTATGVWSVVSIRYRCITPGCEHAYHGKYSTEAGDKPRLYNTIALTEAHDWIVLCEGEIDTLTALQHGVPAVGVPGTESWQPHWAEPFRGYASVFVLADADDKGQGRDFAERVRKALPNAHVRPAMPGYDLNSMVADHGKAALLERIAA